MHSRLSHDIKAEALRLGFFTCGIARADAVDESTARSFREWLAKGNHAEMHYMENHLDKRLDPRLLMDNLKSIVCVALNYAPQPNVSMKISRKRKNSTTEPFPTAPLSWSATGQYKQD